MTIKTKLHTFCFDLREPDQKAAWAAFQADRKAGPKCFGPVLSNVFYAYHSLDGQEIELETKHLFDNQWNTPGPNGRRVFDYALCSHSAGARVDANNAQSYIRRGHWLEQTDEMREIRRNTNRCGYCGHQEAAARGAVFCPKCLGSAFLKESDLHMLRMLPVDDTSERGKLTEAERAHLLPLYVEAQIHALGGRQEAARIRIAEKYAKLTAAARQERDGMLWLLDRGVPLDNVIYYSHSGKFCFGWRGDGVSPAVRDSILEFISEFPAPYIIKCDDGKVLEGH